MFFKNNFSDRDKEHSKNRSKREGFGYLVAVVFWTMIFTAVALVWIGKINKNG